MKRPTLAVCALIAEQRLPPGVAALARRRAEEILKRSLNVPLRDIVAAAYLVGIEDCSDALREDEP